VTVPVEVGQSDGASLGLRLAAVEQRLQFRASGVLALEDATREGVSSTGANTLNLQF
jgi:hypothetical protein